MLIIKLPAKARKATSSSSLVVPLTGKPHCSDVSPSLPQKQSLSLLRLLALNSYGGGESSVISALIRTTSNYYTATINRQYDYSRLPHLALRRVFDTSTSIITGYVKNHKQTTSTSRTHKLTVNQQTVLQSFCLDKSTNTGFHFFTSNPFLH